MKEVLQKKLDEYRRDHQHPVNKATHMVGIPMIVASLPLVFFVPAVGIGLFVLGWILQFVGHAFEGKPPSFFRDPKFLLMGPTWYLANLVKKLDRRAARA
ncbi:MAG: Mpo1-like protein [Myxococcota bacterium]